MIIILTKKKDQAENQVEDTAEEAVMEAEEVVLEEEEEALEVEVEDLDI